MIYTILILIVVLGVLCLMENHEEIMKDEMNEK